jgi:protein SCO1/2
VRSRTGRRALPGPSGAALLAFACCALPAAPGRVSAQATQNEAEAAAIRTSQAAIGTRTSDLMLTDASGRPLRLGELHGRPLVVSFVFTNCYVVCSGLTLHLRDVVRIARGTLGDRSFDVLTIGFDSEHDTPDRMRAYARDRGIADTNWYFATGDAVTVRRLTDELGFTWAPSPRGFDHVTQVTLLDAEGVVAAQVYGDAFQPPEFVEPLKRLVLRQSVERSAVQGLIDRVRLYCTVYDPASRRYRFDYSMLAAGLPPLFALAAVAIGFAWLTRRRH